jgi:ribosomal protein S4
MAKCPIEQGHSIPGMHGGRRPRLKDYGVQLQEKQRLRNMYGKQEGQFRLFFQRALRARGVTGELLLQALEMRLDNVVYRMGLAPSRRSARQFVLHGHVRVDGPQGQRAVLQGEARRNGAGARRQAQPRLFQGPPRRGRSAAGRPG